MPNRMSTPVPSSEVDSPAATSPRANSVDVFLIAGSIQNHGGEIAHLFFLGLRNGIQIVGDGRINVDDAARFGTHREFIHINYVPR